MSAPADHLGGHVLNGATEAEGLLIVERLLTQAEVGQRDVPVSAEQDAEKTDRQKSQDGPK